MNNLQDFPQKKLIKKLNFKLKSKVILSYRLQPQIPLRLPCYDFIPVTDPLLILPLSYTDPKSYSDRLPERDGRYVQGSSSYSPRLTDPRLLAIPPSRHQVSGCDLDFEDILCICLIMT